LTTLPEAPPEDAPAGRPTLPTSKKVRIISTVRYDTDFDDQKLKEKKLQLKKKINI
jgi:hypothetical protein